MESSISSNHTYWSIIAPLSGFIAVVMGAAGAHMVDDVYASSLIEKASYYQLMHSILLLYLCSHAGRLIQMSRWLLFIGICAFSGSLYTKALLPDMTSALAPFGGSCLMLGWLCIALSFLVNRLKCRS